jgi:hypothetical protein
MIRICVGMLIVLAYAPSASAVPVISISTTAAVAIVQFQASSSCSGFDSSTAPVAMMLPAGSTNTARVAIWPPFAVSRVRMLTRDPSKATISPLIPTSTAQAIVGTGIATGSTLADAFAVGGSTPLSSLLFDIKATTVVPVWIYAVTEASSSISPQFVPTAGDLQAYFNQIWGRQANVYFSVTASSFAVNYDLDANGKLSVSTTSAQEMNAILAQVAETPGIFVFYVSALDSAFSGITFTNQPATDAIFSISFIDDSHSNSSVNITAHEVGHALGIPDESSDPGDVMYNTGLSSNPCNVKRVDWNEANRI